MNVREDKMTNYSGQQIGKSSLTCCVPVLLRVSRRFKQENIILDVEKWVVSQSIKERGLFYNFWSISRYSLIKNSCFWKMKVNCANVGLMSFFGG